MTRANDLPYVTVVIPHKGDDVSLAECLSQIRRQTYPRNLYQVIIVLNEPERRGLDIPLLDGETLLWEPDGYSYAARNRGIEEAKGDIIAFTDSDTAPLPAWLSEGVAPLTSGEADLVAGRVTVTHSGSRLTAPALYELMFSFDQQKNVSGGFSTTANFFVPRNAFRQHGLFDQRAQTGEDFSWTRAAVDQGALLTFATSCEVEHPARDSWSELLKKARRTTLAYVGVSDSGREMKDILRQRILFQLRATPSPDRVQALSTWQKSVARLVKLVIFGYKALCLLRIPPAFRRDLDRFQRNLSRGFATLEQAT